GWKLWRHEFALRPSDLALQLELARTKLLDRLVRHLERFDDDRLAYSLGPRLHHEDGVRGAGYDEVELRLAHSGHGRVDDEMAVEVTHAHRADRALEWNVRDHERGRGTVDAQDGGVVFLVDREHCRNDLDVEPEPVREQRAQGPVG